jgi:electron transport complex protein RnfG
MLIAGGLLVVFALVGGGLVSLTYDGTKEQIEANEKAALVRSLQQLIPPDRYDNDPLSDAIEVTSGAFGVQEPVTVFRARRGGQPLAIFTTLTAPDGYSGPIRMLIGVYRSGVLAGVRVISHRETPGLGDAIDLRKTHWIKQLDARSIGSPYARDWKVVKDGGYFDQLTGATVTPRAIVRAVYGFLSYFQANRDALFAPAADLHGARGTDD